MKIREFFFNIATCGPLGAMPGGRLIASLLAIPLTLLMGVLHWLNPFFYWMTFGGIFFVGVLSIYLAMSMSIDQDFSVIVVDKVLGLMIVYCCIALSFKLYIAGFFLFHVANLLVPLALTRAYDIVNSYQLSSFGRLSQLVAIMARDILAGISVHILLRIVVWLGH